ncbi:MAG: phosphatidylserine decarboxylase [Campylobacterales bacterium]|nr:phosphatidylserine decarboxylase [Campylobacterales bacterium]
MKSNLFIIAKSGLPYLVGSALFFFIFLILGCEMFALLAFLAFVLFGYVFRNPERELVNFEEKSILSPVDGVVSAITELDNSEYAYRIDVESSYLDVSLLRAPINGTVKKYEIFRGTRLSKNSKHFSHLNEKASIVFEDKSANKVELQHTLKQSFAPLDISLVNGELFMKSMRYGVMVSGITSIYLPANVRVNVNIGSELKASEVLLGFFS